MEKKFAQAYLAVLRRRPTATFTNGGFSVGCASVTVVRTPQGEDVDFGEPSEWKVGVASRVMSGELEVHTVTYRVKDGKITGRVGDEEDGELHRSGSRRAEDSLIAHNDETPDSTHRITPHRSPNFLVSDVVDELVDSGHRLHQAHQHHMTTYHPLAAHAPPEIAVAVGSSSPLPADTSVGSPAVLRPRSHIEPKHGATETSPSDLSSSVSSSSSSTAVQQQQKQQQLVPVEKGGDGAATETAPTTPPALDALNLRVGTCADRGPLAYMEDECVVLQDLRAGLDVEGPQLSFFAVYDGHMGKESVTYAKKNLHRFIAEECLFNEDMVVAIRDGYCKFDNRLIQRNRVHNRECGVVAVTALLAGRTLYVGHVGDCRAVLCRGGVPIALTEDHKASREDERQRVHSEGGFVSGGRVGGSLAVSRSLGDFQVGEARKLRGVSAEPDVRIEQLTDDDEFLLLASDGIFDVFDINDAVSRVRRALQCNPDAGNAAEQLIQAALEKTDDNCSVLVVCFKELPRLERRPIIFAKERPRLQGKVLENIVRTTQREAEVDEKSSVASSSTPHLLSA